MKGNLLVQAPSGKGPYLPAATRLWPLGDHYRLLPSYGFLQLKLLTHMASCGQTLLCRLVSTIQCNQCRVLFKSEWQAIMLCTQRFQV